MNGPGFHECPGAIHKVSRIDFCKTLSVHYPSLGMLTKLGLGYWACEESPLGSMLAHVYCLGFNS